MPLVHNHQVAYSDQALISIDRTAAVVKDHIGGSSCCAKICHSSQRDRLSSLSVRASAQRCNVTAVANCALTITFDRPQK